MRGVTKPEIQRQAIDNNIAQIDEGLAATISEALGCNGMGANCRDELWADD